MLDTSAWKLRSRPSWGAFALGVALLASTALVIALALQVRQLRADQQWLVDRASKAYAGMYVPHVALSALDGSRHVLGQPKARRQVLYFFTPTCPYCRASVPMMKTLARQLAAMPADGVEMLGVVYAEPAVARAYARQHQLPFPVIATQDRRTSMLFRARKVPLVMVVGSDGRVRHARTGVFNSRDGYTDVLSAVRSQDRPGVDLTTEATP